MVQHLVCPVDGRPVFPPDFHLTFSEVVVSVFELCPFVEFCPSGVAYTVIRHSVELGVYVSGPCPLSVEHSIDCVDSGHKVIFGFPEHTCAEGVLILNVQIILTAGAQAHHGGGCGG